jgi:hypothetical protein
VDSGAGLYLDTWDWIALYKVTSTEVKLKEWTFGNQKKIFSYDILLYCYFFLVYLSTCNCNCIFNFLNQLFRKFVQLLLHYLEQQMLNAVCFSRSRRGSLPWRTTSVSVGPHPAGEPESQRRRLCQTPDSGGRENTCWYTSPPSKAFLGFHNRLSSGNSVILFVVF